MVTRHGGLHRGHRLLEQLAPAAVAAIVGALALQARLVRIPVFLRGGKPGNSTGYIELRLKTFVIHFVPLSIRI